jgi:hypothetical protein
MERSLLRGSLEGEQANIATFRAAGNGFEEAADRGQEPLSIEILTIRHGG